MEQAKTPDEIMASFFGEDDAEPQTIEDFPIETREDIEGLAWLGYLEDAFEFCGHHFVIRTLRGDEELLAALVSKEYVESVGRGQAWIWALVSLSLVAVDGDSNFCPPVGPDKREYARARFQYCTGKWYWALASYLHSRYSALLERQADAIKRLEDLSQGSQPISMPSAGSLTDKGDSEDPTQPAEILDLLDQEDSPDSKPD